MNKALMFQLRTRDIDDGDDNNTAYRNQLKAH